MNTVAVAREGVCSRLDEHVKDLVQAVCDERRSEQGRTELHQATVTDFDTLTAELENDLQLSIDAESTPVKSVTSTPSPPSLADDVEELQRMILEKMMLSPGHVADEVTGKLASALKQVMGQDFCQNRNAV